MTSESGPRRRRRRRAVWQAGVGISRIDEATATTRPTADVSADQPGGPDPAPAPVPAPARAPAPAVAAKRRRGDPSERGLRDLVGSGPSQLGPTRAMRARDANRPTDADLAEAEQQLTIVRRNWQPPNP